MTNTFKVAMDRYYELFPQQTCCFKFPVELSNSPSPHYHQLQGCSFVYLDWQLCWPQLVLPCPCCADKVARGATPHSDSKLVHDRTNLLKNRSLFPIWTPSGSVIYAVVMTYKCQKCNKHVKANDGRLLHLLDAHVRDTYPVLPRYAHGQFHFNTELSDIVDSVMKTYGNAEFVSRQMVAQQGRFYQRKVLSYLSMDVLHPYPDYETWRQDIHPPMPETIRNTYFEAEYSSLQPYGYCNVERYVRELQGVQVQQSDIVTFDHTFQVLKTYNNKGGAKAVFTGMKGSTKEVVSLAAVPSTALKEVTHLLRQSKARRENFSPSVVYTDTCPNGTYVWKDLFGHDIDCRLGLFHFIHRIVDTLDNKCELYWKSMVSLKKCIYTYHEIDFRKLMEALRTGTLSSSRQPMTTDEINQVRHSKQWKSRYDRYLRKVFRSEAQICSYLEEWIRTWDGVEDSCGRRVFSSATTKATREQMSKVQFVLDSEKAIVYSPVPPPKDSVHNLTVWRTNRPESSLEKFHELLAHFGNGAMRKEYADALIYRGTAEYNITCRWKSQKEQKVVRGPSRCRTKVAIQRTYLL